MRELAAAKCPQCDKIAQYDVAAQTVRCKHCGLKASYEEYIGMMAGRLTTLTPGYRAQSMGEDSGGDK
ncbi:MAG: hypothetical protein HYU39_06470 [Thaumarchaeota archaeon]|nr:hypothetical protein [Nitrososphaerota archaeon]